LGEHVYALCLGTVPAVFASPYDEMLLEKFVEALGTTETDVRTAITEVVAVYPIRTSAESGAGRKL
jgi:hypothetical protein